MQSFQPCMKLLSNILCRNRNILDENDLLFYIFRVNSFYRISLSFFSFTHFKNIWTVMCAKMFTKHLLLAKCFAQDWTGLKITHWLSVCRVNASMTSNFCLKYYTFSSRPPTQVQTSIGEKLFCCFSSFGHSELELIYFALWNLFVPFRGTIRPVSFS